MVNVTSGMAPATSRIAALTCAIAAEPDQRRQLAMFAEGITEQLERVRPIDDILRSAAAVDPVAVELRRICRSGSGGARCARS